VTLQVTLGRSVCQRTGNRANSGDFEAEGWRMAVVLKSTAFWGPPSSGRIGGVSVADLPCDRSHAPAASMRWTEGASRSISFWEKVVVGVAFGVPITIERVKAITDLTPEQGACLAGFEAVIKNATAGDFKTDLVHKFKYWPKLDALDRLAEHLNLLKGQGAERSCTSPSLTIPRPNGPPRKSWTGPSCGATTFCIAGRTQHPRLSRTPLSACDRPVRSAAGEAPQVWSSLQSIGVVLRDPLGTDVAAITLPLPQTR
jgi:hypothetical protein